METEEVESKSLMDDLAEAWEKSEEESDGTEQQGSEVLESSSQSDGASGEIDTTPEVTKAGAESDTTAVLDSTGPSDVVDSGTAESEKPPVGLSLESREAWKDVPAAVKADIVKREADYEKGIVQYSQQAKRAQAMDSALAPYQQYLETF